MNYYLSVWSNYAQFNGRARREEFWHFVLFNAIAYIVMGMLMVVSFSFAILIGLYYLAVFIPMLALSVRRMHDVGKSGWYILVSAIPLVGVIWYLVLLCTAGEEGTNEYGPDPKAEQVFA